MPDYKTHAATFYGWLIRQRQRDDPVGDLARDAKLDAEFPRSTQRSLHTIIRHLENAGASDACLEAAKRAWEEWEAYRDGNNTH